MDDYGAVPNDRSPRRPSAEVHETFLDEFKRARGARIIILLGFLTALGLGALLGVVPKVVTQRFAEEVYGLEEGLDCDVYEDDKPMACVEGADYAQAAASYTVLVSNLLALFTNTLVGSYSDIHGRRGIQILALLSYVGAPIAFLAIQLFHEIHPLWYFAWECVARIITPFPIAFTQLSDVLPPKHRAPAFGLFFGSVLAGVAISGFLATLLSHSGIAVFSSAVRILALVTAVLVLPETLSLDSRLMAAETQKLESQESGNTLLEAMLQPLRKLAILRRSPSLVLVAVGAFTSKMVLSADTTLFFYFVENNLGASEKDAAIMMFLAGVMGFIVQAGLLKYLISLAGERKLLIATFGSGVIQNLIYGLAPSLGVVYVGLCFGSLTNVNNALLSSTASQLVMSTEQGQIQGALFGLSALAEAIGPVTFNFVHKNWHIFGHGTMFVVGAILYAIGLVALSLMPKRLDSSEEEERSDALFYLEQP